MCNKIRKQKINKLFILLPNIKMTERKQLRDYPEPDGGEKQTLKTKFAWLALLGTLLLGKLWDWVAQEVKTQERKEEWKEIVIQPTTQVLADTLGTWSDAPRWPSREPDPDHDEEWDETEIEPETDQEWWILDDESDDGTKWLSEKVPDETPTKFTVSTWVWYAIGWKAFMWNRIAWSGKLFQGTAWETFVYSHMDFDDPLHSKWSWKLTLSKSIYKWISLDWDYTFTWSWWNVVRLWIWYEWKLWEWMYWVKIYPLNTWWSPISAKVSYTTKIWQDWQLSSFIFVDFDNMQYYSETEYVQRIIEWIWLFLQIRLWWIIDGSIGSDSQKIVWWVKISVK